MQRIHRGGFTLTELLMVIAIIGILATLSLSVLRGVEEDALKSRTQAQLDRIKQLLDRKLEEYTYRISPIPYQSATGDFEEMRFVREAGIEEILRVEMPSRRNDMLDDPMGSVADPPLFPMPPSPGPYDTPFPLNEDGNPTAYDWTTFADPQMLVRMRAKLGMPADGSNFGTWSKDHESAECLYAILALNYLEDGRSALAILRHGEIADTDGDGNPEIIDAFGDPLLFDLYNVGVATINGNADDPYSPNNPATAIDPHIDPRMNPVLGNLPSPPQGYRIYLKSINTKDTLN